MPDLSWWQWTLGAVCAFSVGLAKTGLPGAAIFVVPGMVLVVGDARLAAGWLLPLLCVGDVLAVAYWSRHADARRLLQLAPWVVVGMAIGAVALSWEEGIVRRIVGVIVLVMIGLYLQSRRQPAEGDPSHYPQPYGIAAGFATTVANAAGPVMNVYLLSVALPKHSLIATQAWFFFVINLMKIPIYAGHQLFNIQSLAFDLLLAPLTVAGGLAGRWIVDHIPQPTFELIILVLAAATTVPLLW